MNLKNILKFYPGAMEAASNIMANFAGQHLGQPAGVAQPAATPLPVVPEDRPYNPFLGYAAVDWLRPEVQRPDDAVVQVFHRGWHDQGDDPKPENSIGAFDAAVKQGATFYEVDLRGDMNGEPILTHDERLGREGDFGRHQGLAPFDPHADKPENGGPNQDKVNPHVREITAAQLKEWDIRQRDLSGRVTEERMSTLRDLLEHNKQRQVSVGIMADIKDIDVLKNTWEILATTKDHLGVPYSESAVLKIGMHKMPSVEQVKEVFNTTHFNGKDPDWMHVKLQFVVVTMTVGNTNFDPEKQEYGEKYVLDSVKSHAKQPYNYGFEIGLKHEGGNLQQTADWVHTEKLLLSHFQPVSEHDNPAAREIGGEFFDADGYCCSNLTSKLYKPKGKNVPPDLDDRRHLSSFMIANNYQVITTDDPKAFGEAIRAASKQEYQDFNYTRGSEIFNKYLKERTPPVTPSRTTPEMATRPLDIEPPQPGQFAAPLRGQSVSQSSGVAGPQPGASPTLKGMSAQATPTPAPASTLEPTRTHRRNEPAPPEPGATPTPQGMSAQAMPTPPPSRTPTRTQAELPPPPPQPAAGVYDTSAHSAPTPAPSQAPTRTQAEPPPPSPEPQSRGVRPQGDAQTNERSPQRRPGTPPRATTQSRSPSPTRGRGIS